MPYTQLHKKLQQIGHLQNIANIINWDYQTNLPTGAADSRQDEMATLSSHIHHLRICPTLGEAITKASEHQDQLTPWEHANLKLARKNYTRAIVVDPVLEEELTKAANKCEFIWRQAREENNFTMLLPHLEHLLTLNQQLAKIYASTFQTSAYDALLDLYDPERSSAEIETTFTPLKKDLPQLIQEIVARQKSQKLLPFTEPLSVDIQKEIGLKVMRKMGFDFDYGRLDISVHPFCGGTPFDVRMTTRYDLYNFLNGLMGIIHETGHGLYEQHLPEEYKMQPVGQAMGMAFHESQSLIMEMQVGRSLVFLEFLSKMLQDEFGLKGPEYRAENLCAHMNQVKPDFIRVHADEVTYPMHVIMRFELEKALIEGDLALKDLPQAWNAKMQDYLGITPPTDTLGCLQDVHWPSGAFGYFPAYTNGALIACMTMQRVKAQHPAVTAELGTGDFSTLNAYLNQNLRSLGCLKSSEDLLEQATGHRHISATPFLHYCREKWLGSV